MMKSWFEISCWYEVKKLMFSCWLWDLRGLKSCEFHGFYAQSWINGKCKECSPKTNKKLKEEG